MSVDAKDVPAAYSMSRYIIASGLPASGKSTLARALAESLAIPVFDKDDLLEVRFERSGSGDVRWRRGLSRSADQEFRILAEQSRWAILVSWWKHPLSHVDSGTAERFAARTRHPGHLDHRWSYAELRNNFLRQAQLGPLGLGRVIEVHGESRIEIGALLRDIAQAFEEARVEQTKLRASQKSGR